MNISFGFGSVRELIALAVLGLFSNVLLSLI